MLSSKAHELLKAFLDTFEQETGFRPNTVQFWGFNGEEEKADDLQIKFDMEWTDCSTHSSVSKTYSLGPERIEIYYTFTPEEERDDTETCSHCGNPMTDEEMLAPHLEDVCAPCTLEMMAENKHQQTEYRQNVI